MSTELNRGGNLQSLLRQSHREELKNKINLIQKGATPRAGGMNCGKLVSQGISETNQGGGKKGEVLSTTLARKAKVSLCCGWGGVSTGGRKLGGRSRKNHCFKFLERGNLVSWRRKDLLRRRGRAVVRIIGTRWEQR